MELLSETVKHFPIHCRQVRYGRKKVNFLWNLYPWVLDPWNLDSWDPDPWNLDSWDPDPWNL